MRVQTKFLRLFREVAIADHIDGWRVCWIGGWDAYIEEIRAALVKGGFGSRSLRSGRAAR